MVQTKIKPKVKATRKSSQPKSQSTGNINICNVFKLTVSDENHNVMYCDSCNAWLHLECSGVTNKQFELISSTTGKACKGLRWLCGACQEKPALGPKFDVSNEQRFAAMEQVVQNMQTQMVQIVQMLGESSKNKIENKIKTQVAEVLNDHKEGNDKRNNIMLFNLPESADENDPVKDDHEKVKKIVQIMEKEISTESISRENVLRLGKRRPHHQEKPRPVRVTFSTEEIKMKVLRKSYKLNKHVTYGRVIASNDKTEKEQQEDRALMAELNEARKERPGDDLIIFKKKIIKRSEKPSYADIVKESASTSTRDKAKRSDSPSPGKSGGRKD